GVGDRLDEYRSGARRHRALETLDIIRFGPYHVPAETFERVRELIDRSAIKLARRDELVTGIEQHLKGNDLRGVAGSRRQCRRAAFQRCDTLFKDGLGRISNPSVNVSERLQSKQRGRMVGIVEHEGCGLIDRRRPCAGGWIGLRAGMDGQSRKTGRTIGHACSCFALFCETLDYADGRAPRRQGDFALQRGCLALHRALKKLQAFASHQERSFRSFAARSDAAVWPPLTLMRFRESRMPWVGSGARFELSVREFTPIQEISEDSRPYSIFGQRFITTLSPAA